jgi:hypothetical protein
MYRFENEAFNKKLNECMAEYEEYRQMMLQDVDYSNPNALIDRLKVINGYNAGAARLRASFEFLLDKATAIEMRKIDHDSMPAKKFDAMVRDAVGLISIFPKALEMMVKESHYQIESIRTSLSYIKTELQNINH